MATTSDPPTGLHNDGQRSEPGRGWAQTPPRRSTRPSGPEHAAEGPTAARGQEQEHAACVGEDVGVTAHQGGDAGDSVPNTTGAPQGASFSCLFD